MQVNATWLLSGRSHKLLLTSLKYTRRRNKKIQPHRFYFTSIVHRHNKQDRQALLKAKHHLRVAPVGSAGGNEVAPSSK